VSQFQILIFLWLSCLYSTWILSLLFLIFQKIFLLYIFLLGRKLFHPNIFQANRMLTCFNSNFRSFWGFSTHYDTPILSIHNKSFRILTLRVIKETRREKKFGTIVLHDAISIMYPDYLVPFLLSMYIFVQCTRLWTNTITYLQALF
jgi:hypothetical protein